MTGKAKSRVAVAACGDYEMESVRRAMGRLFELLGGIERFVRPGQKVFVKPNLLKPAAPELAATTHPAVVQAIIEKVQTVTPHVSFGDVPGGFYVGTTENIYRKTGMRDVARATGAELVRLEARGWEEVPLKDAGFFKSTFQPRWVRECDVVINAPKLKAHTQAKFTGAVKNMFGLAPTRNKYAVHYLGTYVPFSKGLVDIYEAIRPTLTILDGIVGMEGAGPSLGDPANVGFLFASADGVALDAVASETVGFDPLSVETTRLAAERGIGEADPDRIEVVGDDPRGRNIPFKKPLMVFMNTPLFSMKLFTKITAVGAKINASKCKPCALECESICPVNAIENTPSGRRIDRDLCLTCASCFAVCPHGAVEMRKTPFVHAIETREAAKPTRYTA